MRNTSAKNKIYVICAVWIGLALLMFLYAFKILDKSNAALVANYSTQQHNFEVLKAEQNSYQQAKAELEKVKLEQYQPEDFFNTDVQLVEQLKTVEALGNSYNVQIILSGISGTIRTAVKAKTQSDLYQIPYSITLTGNFNDVLEALEAIEHLPFVNTLSNVSMGSGGGDTVTINLSAMFYLRK